MVNSSTHSPADITMVSAGSVEFSNDYLTNLSRGPGKPWVPDTLAADNSSLHQRVSSAISDVPETRLEHHGSSTSSDWFHGKMSADWFQNHLVEIDHSDDRFRRD